MGYYFPLHCGTTTGRMESTYVEKEPPAMRIAILVSTAALVSAASLSGQMHRQRDQGPAEGPGVRMGAMMIGPLARYRQFEPEALLEHADRIGLDDAQRAQLGALQEAAAQSLEDAHAPAQAAMQGLRRELEAEVPDTAAVRQLLSAHMIAMGNMQWARLEAALQARDVLTDEQRTIVLSLITDTSDGMQRRHRGGQGG